MPKIMPRAGFSAAELLGAGAAGWLLLTLASAAQGVVFAWYRGAPQPWWPTLGYAAAIFSVWALLAPALVSFFDRLSAATMSRLAKRALMLLALPVATIGHVLLFVALYGPVYGAAAVSPVAMMRDVLAANIDTAAFAYAALLAAHVFARRRARPAPAAPTGGLWVGDRRSRRLLAFDEIDWIGAAGDYAEIRAAGRSFLIERSLSALEAALPADDFARIHRGTIVRLDRIREVAGVGRGDAEIRLRCGAVLRLSRRYRDRLAAYLPA